MDVISRIERGELTGGIGTLIYDSTQKMQVKEDAPAWKELLRLAKYGKVVNDTIEKCTVAKERKGIAWYCKEHCAFQGVCKLRSEAVE